VLTGPSCGVTTHEGFGTASSKSRVKMKLNPRWDIIEMTSRWPGLKCVLDLSVMRLKPSFTAFATTGGHKTLGERAAKTPSY